MQKVIWTPLNEAKEAEKQATSLEKAAEKFREGSTMLRTAADEFDKNAQILHRSCDETSEIIKHTGTSNWVLASEERRLSDMEKIVDNLASTVVTSRNATTGTLEAVETFRMGLATQEDALAKVEGLTKEFRRNLSQSRRILREVQEIALGDLKDIEEHGKAVKADQKVLKDRQNKS